MGFLQRSSLYLFYCGVERTKLRPNSPRFESFLHHLSVGQPGPLPRQREGGPEQSAPGGHPNSKLALQSLPSASLRPALILRCPVTVQVKPPGSSFSILHLRIPTDVHAGHCSLSDLTPRNCSKRVHSSQHNAPLHSLKSFN